MSLFTIGRVCMKIAGRDAGKRCVVVDDVGNGYVLIEGETRRRRCNIAHLEPTEALLDIQKGAAREDVKKALA